MQPDRTLIMLVTWINLIEADNEKIPKLVEMVNNLREENKKLKADLEKPTKKKKSDEED